MDKTRDEMMNDQHHDAAQNADVTHPLDQSLSQFIAPLLARSSSIDMTVNGYELVSLLIKTVDELTKKIQKKDEETKALQRQLNESNNREIESRDISTKHAHMHTNLLVKYEAAQKQLKEFKENAQERSMAHQAILKQSMKAIIGEFNVIQQVVTHSHNSFRRKIFNKFAPTETYRKRSYFSNKIFNGDVLQHLHSHSIQF